MQLKTQLKNLDLIFFYLFLFLFPFNISLFLGNISKSWSFYNDFIGFWLYLSDILLVLTFIFGFRYLFAKLEKEKKKIGAALISFFIWTLLSIFWTQYRQITFYQICKLFLFILLFFYIAKRISANRKLTQQTYLILFISGTIQSVIGISQFILQKSIGLSFLGEPILSKTLAGVAKIDYQGAKIIRAYGTFPHPNILGGFLLLSLISGVILIFRQNKPNSKHSKYLSILNVLFIPQIACFILTFSRSVWLSGLIIILFSLFYFIIIRKKQIFKYWIPVSAGMTILFTLIFVFPLVKSRLTTYEKAVTDRQFIFANTTGIIKQTPFLGIGWGNFIPRLLDFPLWERGIKGDFINISVEPWQIQPVHNIYILVLAELGLVGLFFFLYFLTKILKNSCLQIKKNPEIFLLFTLFCGFLLIGLFDHYFLTLQQGQIMFWLSAGLLNK